MIRIARERIAALFALAEREATGERTDLADRYVSLARRVGTRYNVRILPEYRELYCRGCSAYWVEGRTARTRLRAGHRVRTCLRCGRERRTLVHGGPRLPSRGPESRAGEVPRDEGALAVAGSEEEAAGLESEEPSEDD